MSCKYCEQQPLAKHFVWDLLHGYKASYWIRNQHRSSEHEDEYVMEVSMNGFDASMHIFVPIHYCPNYGAKVIDQ